MPRGPKGPDIRDVKPTIVLLEANLKINGGTLSSPEIGKVWEAMHRAFERAAHENGLGYSWRGSVGCTTPKRMAAMIARQQLNVELPPSDDAVDPSVADPGKLSTREKLSSSVPLVAPGEPA